MAIRLSKASKMPCPSWSLEALTTCPASKKRDGTLVDACKGCYATTGNYRMHKFAKFTSVISDMQALPNVIVRLSSDSIHGEVIEGETTSTIIPTPEHATGAMTVCEAYTRAGKCGTCRACWDKDTKVVAYPAHGRSMIKLLNIAA